jgi:hypothetical protein
MRRLNDEYLAGLWKRNLPRGLLWLVNGEIKIPPTYRAPFWPWASVDGKLSYQILDGLLETKRHHLFRVLDTVTVPLGQDITSQLIGGHIRVSGSLRKITATRFLTADSAEEPALAWVAVQHNTENSHSIEIRSRTSPEGEKPARLRIHYSIPHNWIREEMFLMPLLLYDREEDHVGYTRGLVLYSEDGLKGTYKRVGLFVAERLSAYRKIFLSESRLEDEYYESEDRFGQYTIRIV